MKKFLSILLVLCMVFTTLMGTMVVDVNAAVEANGMTYTITEGTATDYSDRKIVADMPNTRTAGAAIFAMLYGNWRINTPYYDASKTDAENEGAFIDIGSFRKHDALGMEFVHFYNPEAKSITITDTENKFNYNNKNYYYRFAADAPIDARKSTEDNLTLGTASIASMSKDDINTNVATDKKVAHYSFYAFADSAKGTLTTHFLNSSSSSAFTTVGIEASAIVSENKVPRKIDMLLYADCDDGNMLDNATAITLKIYIDGKYYKCVQSKIKDTPILQLRTYVEMYMHKAGSDDVINISSPAKDFYVGFNNTAFEYITRDEASATAFETINYNTIDRPGTYRDNVVTGVDSEMDATLETLFTSTAGNTDKIIELYESVYNNPVAIYDTDNSTDSNVVLVDKATGVAYNESNIPAGKTLDDLYISVNGVFVLAQSIPDPVFVKNGNDITYRLNADELKGFDVGNWNLSDGTVKVNLGSTSDNAVNAGMAFKKIQLNAGTLSGIAKDAAPVQLRTEVYNDVEGSDYLSTDLTYTETDMAQQGFSVKEYNEKVVLISGKVGQHSDGDGVALYTMYAYSKKSTGEPLKVNMTANGKDDANHTLDLPASILYSENGVPHKIDIVIYDRAQSNSFNGKGFYRYKVYIDGLLYTCLHGASTGIATDSDTVSPTLSLKLTPADGTLSWIDTEWYVWAPSKNLSTNYARYSTKGDITDFIFESTVNWESSYTKSGTIKEDVVNGVTADVDGKLNAVLLSKTVDNVIELAESIYNNPVAIFDGTATNVKLIDKVTGVEYTSANIGNKTFDDMYICVDGVYVLVESVPDADLTFDKGTKLAKVRANLLSAGTTCRIIVGAYNNDKLADIKVSDELTATANTAVTYTATGIEEGAEEYKIFVFDSLRTIKPLVEALIVR